ncbi:MAG: SapC family protein, partial [Pseudoalteromonas sp.]
PNAAVEYAKTQHLVNLRANEIAKVACDLPIFLARNAQNGSYTISALTSFNAGQSLLVNNNQWQALYTPVCMQTHPLHLMTREANSSDYFIAIDEQSSAVNSQHGEALFDAKGNPSLFLNSQQKLLESDLKNDYQTYQFTQEVVRLGLIKNIDIALQFEQGETQTIQGLSTVDEDKLQTLDSNTIAELQKKGYLSVLNSMLISLFQLNALVKLHNQHSDLKPLKQIKLELSRDSHAL